MAKEDGGRLLSKVAKFVRNPLKDWSELDADDGGATENGYSREMLKEMIERRQRNDFVRRREFDMLRKLRRREAAGGGGGATASSFNVSSTSGRSDGRALTLKKIDEIEEQMSQQWWKGRSGAPAGETTEPGGEDEAARQARAYADTVPGVTPARAEAHVAAGAHQGSRPGHDGIVEEAAIRFAHGDHVGAEAILLQAVAPEGPSARREETWLALFDLYRATGDLEKFTAATTRHAQWMKKAGPEWVSLRALALEAGASMAAAGDAAAPAGERADWASPPRLSREALLGLTRALAAAGPTWRMDWSALEAIDADAAGPLRALFSHWADSPVQLRFLGCDRLLLVLAEATPVNERRVDVAWWQLHMAALRMMHRADEFELLALNYCITYEVSPPPWEDPKGDFAQLDAPSSAAAALSSSRRAAGPVLAGEIVGEAHATWQRLDAELAAAQEPVVSCAALVRVDFAAGGTLLNWAMARSAHQPRVRFVDVHRLVAAFFGVVGIADHAEVVVRAN